MSWKPQRAVFLSLVFLLALSLRSQAHADTYELFQFTDYNGAGPVLGIDNSGEALYRSPCFDTTFSCYSVFQPFGPGYSSPTLPPVAFNMGGASANSPCPVNPLASFGLCNNGYEAYWISPAIGGQLAGVYGGPIADVQRFQTTNPANSTFFHLDSFGDLAWTDGQLEENFLAYNLTAHEAPEPATLVLLATGLILLAAIARRRLIRA